MAKEAYLEAIRPETSAERREEVRRGLVAYCGLDTMALLRMADFLEERNTNPRAERN
jgi:hypothetical protein